MNIVTAVAVALVACPVLRAQVELRQGQPPPPGQIVAVDEQGVRLHHHPDGGAASETTVSWDRVRSITGDYGREAAALSDVADQVWRARTRIERGDWRLGEPLFERLFAQYGTLTGPTSAVVAEGLLRCRLRRGAQAAAVGPWLALVRLHRVRLAEAVPAAEAGDVPTARHWLGGHTELPPIMDEATALAPALPPIWLSGPAVEAMADSPAVAMGGAGDDVAEQLADLYHLAAAFEGGRDAVLTGAPSSGHPGVALVSEVVAARIGSEAQRQAARDALLARLAAEPASWIQVWCHAGIGRSLLRETDDSLRRRGVLHLLHIPAAYGAEHPYLAGVALAESAVALADAGDQASAATLRAELERKFSDHPALAWPPLRRTPSSEPLPAGAEPDPSSSPSSTAPPDSPPN